MKLVVKREPFTMALTAAEAVVPLRGVRPSLKNALLAVSDDGWLEIQATDMEVGLRFRVKAESVQNAANVCLPCKTVAGLLRECTEEIVTLETSGPKGVLSIGDDRFEVLGQDTADFPDVPSMGDGAKLAVPAAELARAIDRTAFAAAREQGRYAINGVYMICKPGASPTLEVVATDGRRLAFCKQSLKAAGCLEEGVIIPVKMMQEIRKLCEAAGSEEVQIGLQNRSVIVRGGPVTLSSLVVEGIFPKYQQVIPKDGDKEVVFNREALLHGLRKAIFLTSDETKTVQLTFSPGTCLIEARSPEKGQAAVKIEAQYKGDSISIGFNPQYLHDALKVLDVETIKLELKDGTRPGILRAGPEYLYVLMPVNP